HHKTTSLRPTQESSSRLDVHGSKPHPVSSSSKAPRTPACTQCSYQEARCSISRTSLQRETKRFLYPLVHDSGLGASGQALYPQPHPVERRWKPFLRILGQSLGCMEKDTLTYYRHLLENESDRARNSSHPTLRFPVRYSKRVVQMIVQLDILRKASYLQHWTKSPLHPKHSPTKKRQPVKLGQGTAPASYVYTAKDLERFQPQTRFLRWPAHGRLSSLFGLRRDPFHRRLRMHRGLDISAPFGTPVYAAASGMVLRKGWMGRCGLGILLQHRRSFRTLYCHLSQILVAHRTSITAGTLIGRIGSTGRSTGPHLHFGLFRSGKAIDPYPYLKGLAQQPAGR
ncbi:MAG: M23 family metallopeptidase, partial [Myxococcota bacterium]